jgi:hypothetical protein
VNRRIAWVALAAAVVGVFLPWTADGPVRLDGTEGPHNGWLVVIVAAFALGWARSMHRGSWIGVIGVLGTAVVIAWTALESWLGSSAVSGATPRSGFFVVLAASAALGYCAVAHAVELARRRRG